MALRKNTNPVPVQLNPEFQDLLIRNGMKARLFPGIDDGYQLIVQGHDSSQLTYDIGQEQVRKLTGWGSNYANRAAYDTFIDIVKDDFDVPKDFVHARNANGRVAMGLHGYRIGAGEYGRPEQPLPFWRRFLLEWTPRHQEGYHLRQMDGGLCYPESGAPIVPERPDGRIKPGELQSGGYGFYRKEKQEEKSEVDPLSELEKAFAPVKVKEQGRIEPAIPYKTLITSPVYFTHDKFQQCLSSHGIQIDAASKTLDIQSTGSQSPLRYNLNEEELAILTSESIREHPLKERLAVLNNIIGGDFKDQITVDMLNSKEMIQQQISNETPERTEKLKMENQEEYRIKPDGKIIPILSEMEGHHWEQDISGGRDVVVNNVKAYQDGNQYYLKADVNGQVITQAITAEQFKDIYYKNDEARIALVDTLLAGITLKEGDYQGEAVNARDTDADRLAEVKDGKAWYREGKDGREVSVGPISVQQAGNGRYAMTGIIDGEAVTREISQRDYDKFLAMDDYHRMRLFSKIFDEVDIKSRLGIGERVSAALAAGMTVMDDLGMEGGRGMYPCPPHGPEFPVRAYFKPGVDSPEEIARRNYDAAINMENSQNGLKK